MTPPSFDHEKLDVYQLSIAFVSWAGALLDAKLESPVNSRFLWATKPAEAFREGG